MTLLAVQGERVLLHAIPIHPIRLVQLSVCLSVCLSVNPNRIRLGDNVCLSVFDQHFLSGNNSNTRNKLTHEIINNTIEYGHELEVFDTLRVVMRNRYLIPDMTGYRDKPISTKKFFLIKKDFLILRREG